MNKELICMALGPCDPLWLSLVQFSSIRVQLFATPWTAVCQASLSITKSQSLLKLMSIESVMPSSPSPRAFNLPQHQGLYQ